MKKVFILLGLAAISSAVAVGVSTKVGLQQAKATTVHGDTLTIGANGQIEIDDSSFFSNWGDVKKDNCDNNDPVTFKSAGDLYACGSFNAFGSFFDGCTDKENYKYTLSSRRWNQTTPYIYFQWGCASDVHKGEANNDEKIVFNFYNTADGAKVTSKTLWNNTFCGVTMLTKNLIIDKDDSGNDILPQLTNSSSFYMSIDFVDERIGEYGAHVFGNLHVNQTHEQVSDAQWHYYKNCTGVGQAPYSDWDWGGGRGSVDNIRSHYYLNDSLKVGFATGFSESFDSQESFNKNFLKDGYGNDDGERHEDLAISGSSYRNADEHTGYLRMPFNRSGSGFFKGWYGGADGDTAGNERGYVASDDSMYRFVSKPFYLPENGIVSVKMAGNSASLHLLNFDSAYKHDDQTCYELAFVDVKTFKTDGNNIIAASDGRNICTMVRHIINFSKYGGRLVQLAIADVSNSGKAGGWNAAYFDELKADYDSFPGFKIDAVEQATDGQTTTYAAIRDCYVTSVEADGGVDYKFDDGPADDDSALLEAYEYVENFYDDFRADGSFKYLTCDFNMLDLQACYDNYYHLSATAKAIVDGSNDFTRGNNASGTWYEKPVVVTNERTIGYVVSFIVSKYGLTPTPDPDSSNFFFVKNENNIGLIIIISISALTLLGFAVLFAKKRKQN